ncbi:HlyD family secretion protein [Aliivibrio sp. EL58]|uniref:HlyD family secretion protein n=1 Tax=Aliivibrio sp. EL58 TaxID=2107582 RepID=UPI000EFAEC39|nr:HlyD family efflux transporter periplasmic adaptor subunit [Aliivibrio sp. EL58]
MLFRKEVTNLKQNRLTGKMILTQPPSFYVISIVTFVFLVISIIYLIESKYSRKETVKGYLLPQKGVIKVYSGRTGILDELFVHEGDIVEEGQLIAKIRNSQSLVNGVEVSEALSKEIKIQIEALTKEKNVTEILFKKDEQRIKRQLVQLQKSLQAMNKAKETSQQRFRLKENLFYKNRSLHQKGFLSSALLSSIQELYLEALEATNRLEREIASVSVDIDNLKSEHIALPEKRLLKKAVIQRQISELQVKLVELNNTYEFIKKAPESGMVTAIQPSIGTQINADSPILSIIPEGSPLEVELLLPTSSAGFVQIGDEVKIRFDAFPYQKFGLSQGFIINIDKALILPTDKILPIKMDEAIYRVRVKLTNQIISAYGKKFPLKVGMIADADIILEKRSLLEWLLDPIYAIKGKM